MQSIILRRIAGTALFTLLAVPLHTMAQNEQEQKARRFPHYTVTDLGTLGGTSSIAFGLNNRSHVGGQSTLANGATHAFLWTKDSGMQDLGTLGGPNSSGGGPNARDEVPVLAEVATLDPYGENVCGFGSGFSCLGAVWGNGSVKPLSTLGGNNAEALGMNNKGQVIGLAETSTYDASCSQATPNQVLQYEAVIWEPNGHIRELAPRPGDTVGFALSINKHGQAVGSSGTCANTPLLPLQIGPHAVLWEHNGTSVDLGSLGGSVYNTAASINDLGEVVGASDLPGDTTIHTFLWTKERGIRDLGTVGADRASLPGGMGSNNNNGQVVGESCDVDPFTAQTQPNCRAYLWQNGKMMDLNTLIPADSPLYLLFAFGITDSGEIAGFAVQKDTGDIHGFLATPCDEDNTELATGSDKTENPRPVLSESARQLINQQLAHRYHIAGTR